MESFDLVVIGGGPAGTTVASIVKKYSPHLRVLILEKAHFPRHHIGQSLLAGASAVLREMDAYDRINSYGFVEKAGATYVWGHDRKPWGFTFDRVVKRLLDAGQPLPEVYSKGWQVPRHEYDHQLLLHAEAMGAEVRQGAGVTKLLRDDDSNGALHDSRVIGVEYRDDRGVHSVHSTWVMDCTGQDALIGRELGNRQYSEKMNNYALWGYWQNPTWDEAYMGLRHFTRIFIATSPSGWFWCIPVRPDVLSVGLVTNRATLQRYPGTAEELYRTELAGCDEVRRITTGATLVRIAHDQHRDINAIQDWSYESLQKSGKGWALAGDAAGFVDPILSSGVMIAHEMGQKAAFTLNSAFRASSDEEITSYWRFYEETYRSYLRAYRDMAEFWYGNNFLMESWWWQAQRTITQDASSGQLSDAEAFMRVASGYANRTESLSLFGSYPLHEAHSLVNGLFGIEASTIDIGARYADRPLTLKPNASATDGLYYFQGLIRKTRRVTNRETGAYLDLHPAEDALLRLIDGAHTLADLSQASDQIQATEARMPVRSGVDLVVQLDNIGVIA